MAANSIASDKHIKCPYLLDASMIFSAISTKLSATTSTSPNTSGTGSISQTEHHAALNLKGGLSAIMEHCVGVHDRPKVSHPFAFAPDASHM